MNKYMDVIMAGFGGQGVMLIGNLLAYSCMKEKLNVTYIPVYGPEMRGGTANCTVVVSDDEIGSPIIHYPKSLISMNRPSLEKFQPRVEEKGIQIVNSSLIDEELVDNDRIQSMMIPVNDIADKIGNTRMANMVALGAYVAKTGVCKLESVIASLENVISPRYHKLIPKNTEALEAGAEFVS